ncbi:MAG TPA: hypothetical protein VEI01_22600 [Terriglobales bacterium]|nr:hypothetical protein [Terriglobales bacterium]HXY52254.1 hypothetical protein [Terriglobales bacterium]
MSHNDTTNGWCAEFPGIVLSTGVAVLILSFCLSLHVRISASDNLAGITSAQQAREQSPESGTPGRTRVAEGEYKVLSQAGIGSFVPAVYDFTESWTLWRLEDGTFEVNGTRNYRSPADEAHSDNFEARLSGDLRVVELKEFRRLRWRPDIGLLTCDFLPGKVACTANSRDKNQNMSLDVPVQAAAGLLWPISAFSLSSITRSASHDPKAITPVELLTFEEISSADPVFTTTLGGHLKYLGQEKLLLAGREWLADKFELKVATHAPFLLWTSSQGLLLAFAYEKDSNKTPQEGMVLASFHDSELVPSPCRHRN